MKKEESRLDINKDKGKNRMASSRGRLSRAGAASRYFRTTLLEKNTLHYGSKQIMLLVLMHAAATVLKFTNVPFVSDVDSAERH